MQHALRLHLESYAGNWVGAAPRAFELFAERIAPRIKSEKEIGITIYPSDFDIFKAFRECPFEKTKVVILASSPFIDGSATGLCYDNFKTRQPTNPSLGRILARMRKEGVGRQTDSETYLGHLPAQGVLLLNVALTVRRGEPGSHDLYWRDFSQQIIRCLNQLDNVIHIQWGKKIQSFCEGLITNSSHSIIRSSNPSPLAGKEFLETETNFFSSIPEIVW